MDENETLPSTVTLSGDFGTFIWEMPEKPSAFLEKRRKSGASGKALEAEIRRTMHLYLSCALYHLMMLAISKNPVKIVKLIDRHIGALTDSIKNMD